MSVVTWHREKSFLASGWCRVENYSSVLPDLRRRAAEGASGTTPRGPGRGPQPRSATTRWAPDSAVAAEWARRMKPLPWSTGGVPGCGSDTCKEDNVEAQLPKLTPTSPDLSVTELTSQHHLQLECDATAAPPRSVELSFYGARVSSSDLVRSLARPGLRSLNMSECEISDLRPVTSLSELRELRLARCSPGVTQDFVASLGALRKLEVLDLSFCPGVTDDGIQEFCKGHLLTHVELCSCPGISDSGVLTLARANPSLHTLSLALNPENLAAEGVAKALLCMRRLRCLDLAGCPQLHHTVPAALVRHCEYIEDLRLASLRDLSNDSARLVLQRCAHLERLSLAGCTGLTEDMLLEAVPRARRLRWISLSGVPNVSMATLAALRELCPDCTIERHSDGPTDPNDLTYVLPPPKPQPKAKVKAKAKARSKDRGKSPGPQGSNRRRSSTGRSARGR